MTPPYFKLLLQSPLALLIALRWLAITGQSLAIALAEAGLGMHLPLLPLCLMLVLQLLFNIWSMWCLAREQTGETPPDQLALQFTFDTLALAVMLYFTGGAFNPFVSLFLVPLAIAAVMVPVAYTCCLVILTIFLYGSLMDNSIPLPEPSAAMTSQISLHLFGMWVNFIISACLITGFVTYLSSRLKGSLQTLRLVREQNLRQEQILALATLAAGTAHELGTPLATMAVVMADLEQDVPENLKADVRLVQQQIGVCKEKLVRMVLEVRQGSTDAEPMPLIDFTERVLEHFSLLRPTVKIQRPLMMSPNAGQIAVDRQLEQALLNLLNNAADVSPEDVSLRYQIRQGRVRLEIRDRGPGLAADLMPVAGSRIVRSSTENGMGIGLLLSNATVERHGGEVRISPREGGGTIVTVSLPILGELHE
ncbi:MAG: ATP-binding protein [Fluviicoccus sp.]|uniref:ATP-binding protein n=1 Tax=Fluviicoccus sp. TaxID=2003552 RepID=UPI002721E78C|nr:ATP-binding protein [Fluviicoccus sp.]MDO8328996.1 ATP-binding protein [Fluviicoccus sp.]